MAKLAIIGASTGQFELCRTAKKMGLTTIGFAWRKGAVCKDLFDTYYPVSVLDKECIVRLCKEEHVDGVISSASDLTAGTVAYVAEELGLPGNPYAVMTHIQDKAWVRERTNDIPELTNVSCSYYEGEIPSQFPCIVKPISGSSKRGVSYVPNVDCFEDAVEYARDGGNRVIIESYVQGHEFSVETISYAGRHHVIQITDKVSSGPPHFVELEHHQPSLLPSDRRKDIKSVVSRILDRIGFENGAAHLEMKMDEEGRLFLIEVNPRGGGDRISDTLVKLSTGYDYVKGMVLASLGTWMDPVIDDGGHGFSGIFFLCQQNQRLLPYFTQADQFPWIVEKEYDGRPLVDSLGNGNRNGYLIYHSDHRIRL